MSTRPARIASSRRRLTASYWIRTLGLKPHPEGGYFRETYRSAERVAAAALPARYGGARAFATAIYFLLAAGQVSRLHRLRSDELWHFHHGAPLRLTLIAPDGALIEHRLGHDAAAGDCLQAVIPAGAWMGARLATARGYALVGCTVAPGFAFEDFELGRRASLCRLFPQHRETIATLT